MAAHAVQELWADLPAGRMRYLRSGVGGPPLLLIHGLLGYSFSWRLNLSEFAQHFTVFAPDLLGTGFSDRPPLLDCSLRAGTRRLLEFMETAGIGNADVIGTSHGGALAAMLAAEAPGSVRRLVLAAPVNPWSPHGRLRTRVLATPMAARALRRCSPVLRPLHGYFLRRMHGDPRRIAPGTLEGYSRPVAVPGTLDYLLNVMACWHADLRQLEHAYECLPDVPVLLLWGERDGAVLPQSAQEMQRRLRNSELVIMKGIGHLPYEEAPEEFNSLVLDFLRS